MTNMKPIKWILKYLTSPSFRLVLNYRIGRYLILHPNVINRLLAKWYKYRQVTKRACHISYNSKIGKKISFPHPLGIVIGAGVEIGDGVKIWQNVTLGSHGRKGQEQGYPKIGSGVRIYEGATIIGDVTIGENAVIGAKSFVTKNIPAGATAFGIPAKVKI